MIPAQTMARRIQDGDLVLVRNSRVEKELDQKTNPRYLGPFEVLRRTQGGSYILKEMDGTLSRQGVAAFRLLPYHACEGIPLPIDDLHLDDLDDSDDVMSTKECYWLG